MNWIKNYIFSISWLAILLFLTLSPGSSIPPVSIIGIDKLVHLVLFFVLFMLFSYELNKANPNHTFSILIPACICLIIGILIECIQIYVPDRTFSLLDIAANSTGILIGTILLPMIKKKYN